eukprot:jgi/Botrbrau1/12336/Bobra.4_3s0008.1
MCSCLIGSASGISWYSKFSMAVRIVSSMLYGSDLAEDSSSSRQALKLVRSAFSCVDILGLEEFIVYAYELAAVPPVVCPDCPAPEEAVLPPAGVAIVSELLGLLSETLL